MAEGIQIKNLPSATTVKQGDTMTIVQDKQNKQLSLDMFANESDLGTLSVLENRCDEVKNKIEVDEYSAEITTSQSMSKIGSDDSGANLHENVLDGAFESCVLKGHTKYRDIDTGEILETFEEGRNLELITVRMPILHTVGVNWFDHNNFIPCNKTDAYVGYENGYVVANINVESTHFFYKADLSKMPRGVYSIIDRHEGENSYLGIQLTRKDGTKTWGKKQFDNDGSYAELGLYMQSTTSAPSLKVKAKIMLIMGDNTTTPHEDHKSSILSFNQKDDKTIVLRSLPNGVCDTLNVETGEYVQRIGEVMFDGSDNRWRVLTYPPQEDGTHYQFQYWLGDNLIGGDLWNNSNAILADTLPTADGTLHWGGKSRYGIGGDRSNFMITWEKSSCPFCDVPTLNAWLTQNPITVQYPLATPIVTTIDVQGFPHAYKNGHIQLSSGSIEPSLTPTVTYKVPTSRMGQIASNTKSSLRQSIKLDQLEVLVYQSLINTEYENLLVQNSAESATSFRNLSVNDPKDGLYYMLKHLIEENQPVQNMLDKINLFYLYGLLSDEHYFDLLLGGEEDVY